MAIELFWFMQDRLWPEASGDSRLCPVDSVYSQLTEGEIKELLAYWTERKAKLRYMVETWDCDDFALEFHYWARRWVAERSQGESAPPAVGMAFVKITDHYDLFSQDIIWIKGAVYHVINVILRDDGQWLFLEPQSGKLSPIEGSIYEGSIEVVKIHI